MSKKIGFVCDSTADFPPGLARTLRIHTLPVHIMVGEKDHLHGVSISNTEVIMAEEKNRLYKGNCSIWLAYAGNKEEALITRDKLAARTGRKAEEMQLAEVGATISVHTGPGSVCIAMSPN